MWLTTTVLHSAVSEFGKDRRLFLVSKQDKKYKAVNSLWGIQMETPPLQIQGRRYY